MPNGKTHDAITSLLAIPVLIGTFVTTRDIWLATIVSVGFAFGGLMFGPDLDTVSTQYSRWKVFRFLWIPYRMFFRHRSRWSHGLIFGTLIRVVYFMGVVTCLVLMIAVFYSSYERGIAQAVVEFTQPWSTARAVANDVLGEGGVWGLFVGLWLGAASHTFTDLAGTYIKTGRARV